MVGSWDLDAELVVGARGRAAAPLARLAPGPSQIRTAPFSTARADRT